MELKDVVYLICLILGFILFKLFMWLLWNTIKVKIKRVLKVIIKEIKKISHEIDMENKDK